MDDPVDSDLNHESLIHDLNNVFETITEAAELLSTDRHWRPLAATLSRSVERGKRLLGSIPDRTPNLTAIIEDAIQCAADYCIAARKPRLTFVKQLPPYLSLPGVEKDWERVFANLFLNTAQVMRKPGRIEIEAEEEEGALKITIADNGPGIPADILPRVFRAHVSTKTNTGGRSGLGLHIVATIVKKYSGRVTAANRESTTGAVFTIHLPGG
jgi:signal transduction histidine kinase